MKPTTHLSLFFIISSLFVLFGCERSVPKDMMFCKTEEVFVLEEPFNKESAIIVIYKGDDVKLMGDTAYQMPVDRSPVDSSDYYVKVSAKRGVVGWVHRKELQHERPKTYSRRIKAPSTVQKDADAGLDSSKTNADSSAIASDSIGTILVSHGKYSLEADGLALSAKIDSLADGKRRFKLSLSGANGCKQELNGEAQLKDNSMQFKHGDCTLIFYFSATELSLREEGNCPEKNCAFVGKLSKRSN